MAGDGFLFTMQHQEQSLWCWVATAASVGAYYEPTLAWEQCFWVDDAFGLNICCTAGSTPACNRPGNVGQTLIRMDHLARVEEGPAWALENEIAARRPIAVMIRWRNGSHHFPLISGYLDVVTSVEPYVVTRHLYIHDPWYGRSFLPYHTFRTAYQGEGHWWYSYCTK